MFDYVTTINVRAVQWTGENIEEMKWLLKGIIEDDFDGEPCVYRQYIEPIYLAALGYQAGYYLLQFEAWGDDQEVDPGIWVVVYSDGEGELMDNEQFNRMGFVKK